jgi:hypothetical protein
MGLSHIAFCHPQRNDGWMRHHAIQPRKARPGRRKNIGDDIRITELPDGGFEWEIALSKDELADLQAEADETSLTVAQVIKWRLLGDSYLARELMLPIKTTIADLQSHQATLRLMKGRTPAHLSAPVLSFMASQLQNLTGALDTIEKFARRSDSQDILAIIATVRTEINNTMTAVLDTENHAGLGRA